MIFIYHSGNPLEHILLSTPKYLTSWIHNPKNYYEIRKSKVTSSVATTDILDN